MTEKTYTRVRSVLDVRDGDTIRVSKGDNTVEGSVKVTASIRYLLVEDGSLRVAHLVDRGWTLEKVTTEPVIDADYLGANPGVYRDKDGDLWAVQLGNKTKRITNVLYGREGNVTDPDMVGHNHADYSDALVFSPLSLVVPMP